jgi:signal transduction histidine kinase
VLDLSRLESGKVELLSDIFDPSEVASKCVAMLAARIAEKDIGTPRLLPLLNMCRRAVSD